MRINGLVLGADPILKDGLEKREKKVELEF
jgi:hypothetical protein